MKKGAIVAAVSFVVIVSAPKGQTGDHQATTAVALVAVPGLQDHEEITRSVQAQVSAEPLSKEDVYRLFREIKVLGDYGPQDEATLYMSESLPRRRATAQDMVGRLIAERSEAFPPELRTEFRRKAILELGSLAPVFGQEEMRYPKEEGKPFTLSNGMLRFSCHISLGFVWELYSEELRAH